MNSVLVTGVIAQSGYCARQKVHVLVLFLSLLGCVIGAYRLSTYERNPGINWNNALDTILVKQTNGALVDHWTYPELRYWVEYSGQYDQFRDAWIERGIEIAGADDKADTQDLEAFFSSSYDSFLVRNESLLEGVKVPPNFRVERLETWGDADAALSDGPILLVRK